MLVGTPLASKVVVVVVVDIVDAQALPKQNREAKLVKDKKAWAIIAMVDVN